jgi:hypothetical protein
MLVVRPMAAVTQRLEAVVMPFTLSFSAQIVPAPMKPIPATMPVAILAGSIAKLMEMVVNRHEPSKTGMWVRQPTGLQLFRVLCLRMRLIPLLKASSRAF